MVTSHFKMLQNSVCHTGHSSTELPSCICQTPVKTITYFCYLKHKKYLSKTFISTCLSFLLCLGPNPGGGGGGGGALKLFFDRGVPHETLNGGLKC